MKGIFRPLVWTGPVTPDYQRRSRGTFKATWSQTLDLLDRELEHLSARDLVIEADFREQDIRVDGMPRSNARHPVHPGVRIAFSSVHGPLIYGTDSCAYWQHNVRSIALGLEALRAVDRYGVTRRGEQYTGWKAIAAAPTAATTREEALRTLAELAGVPFISGSESPAVYKARYRQAARLWHPDVAGHREKWDRLEAAMKILGGA